MRGVLEVGAIAVAAAVVAALLLGAFAVRRVMRRLRGFRTRIGRLLPAGLQVPGPVALTTGWASLHRWSFDARMLTGTGERRWALALRRDLWVHVDAAGAAVEAGRAADAPLGDLGRLNDRIRGLARDHDRRLALLPDRRSGMDLHRARVETARITGCADEVARAAWDALDSVSAADARRLQTLVAHEARAVSEGASRLRSMAG